MGDSSDEEKRRQSRNEERHSNAEKESWRRVTRHHRRDMPSWRQSPYEPPRSWRYNSRAYTDMPRTPSYQGDPALSRNYNQTRFQSEYYRSKNRINSMGFKELKQLIFLNDNAEAIIKLIEQKRSFFQLIHDNIYENNLFPLIIELIMIVCNSSNDFEYFKLDLLKTVFESRFIGNICEFMVNLADADVDSNNYYWRDPYIFWENFLAICETVVLLLPSIALKKFKLIRTNMKTCLEELKQKYDFSLSDDLNAKMDILEEEIKDINVKLQHLSTDDSQPSTSLMTQKTSKEPQASTSKEPQISTSKEPQASMFKEPQILTSKESQASTSKEPQISTSKEQQTSNSKQNQKTTSKKEGISKNQILTKEMPCGHYMYILSTQDPSKVKCNNKIKFKSPHCGHEVYKLCHADPKFVQCPKMCNTNLQCGHKCDNRCHANEDPNHERYICRYRCNRRKKGCTAGQGAGDLHMCAKKCYEPCNHCDEYVIKRRSCGHQAQVTCSVDVDDTRCEQDCRRVLSCGHVCKKKCYEDCGPCTEMVMKTRACGHRAQVTCWADVDETQCEQDCKRVLDCSHKCKKKCYEDCEPCTVMVKKIIPQCQHENEMECGQDPSQTICKSKCERQLSCGHPCEALCCQPCDAANCVTLISRKFKSACGHYVNLPCRAFEDLLNDKLDPKILLEYCKEPCNKVLDCGHVCAGTCASCRQGRMHEPCKQPCTRVNNCGHLCEAVCNQELLYGRPCPEICKSCQPSEFVDHFNDYSGVDSELDFLITENIYRLEAEMIDNEHWKNAFNKIWETVETDQSKDFAKLAAHKTYLNTLVILRDIHKKIHDKKIQKLKVEFHDVFEMICNFVVTNMDTVTEQVKIDIKNEIKRMEAIVLLSKALNKKEYVEQEAVPEVVTATKEVKKFVLNYKRFKEEEAFDALKRLEDVVVTPKTN